MTAMSMGSNIELNAAAVRACLRWRGGPGVPDLDAVALLLAENGEVASDADFVFYNEPQHHSGAVRMAGKTPPPTASDSVDVDLARVPAATTRVVLAASTDGGTLRQVPELELVLHDLASGTPIATFAMQPDAETAYVTAELYRRGAGWKFRAVGQGYGCGLAGLAADFGIDIGPAEPPAAPSPDLEAPAPSLDLDPPAAPASLDLDAPESPPGPPESPVPTDGFEPPPPYPPRTSPYPPAPAGFAPPAPPGYAPIAPAHEPHPSRPAVPTSRPPAPEPPVLPAPAATE